MRNLKKPLSLFLALSMVFSMVCTTAFADEGPETVRPLGDDVLGSAQNEAPPTAGSEEDEAPQPEVTEETETKETEAEETEETETEETEAGVTEETEAKETEAEETEAGVTEETGTKEPKAPITAEELIPAVSEVITEEPQVTDPAVTAFLAAVTKLQELQDQDDPDPDEFMAASENALACYGALSQEQKDTLPEGMAEAMETLRTPVNPTATCTGDSCTHVAAIGEEHYATLQEAIDAIPAQETGTVDVIADAGRGSVKDGKKITVNIAEGVTVTDPDGKYYGLAASGGAELTITGAGNIVGFANGGIYCTDENTIVNVSKDFTGTIKGKASGLNCTTNAVMNVHSGKITQTDTTTGTGQVVKVADSKGAKVNIYGGTFTYGNGTPYTLRNRDVPFSFYQDEMGKVIELTEENSEAMLGDTYCRTLLDAVLKAPDSENVRITLLKDVDLLNHKEPMGGESGTEDVPMPYVEIYDNCNITLDLNRHTIFGALLNHGILTVTGNGTVDASDVADPNGTTYHWPAVQNCKEVSAETELLPQTTIENGTFKSGKSGVCCIYDQAGTVEIKGGSFTATGNQPAVLKVSNSSYDTTVKISGGTFSSDVSAYVVEGYKASEADGTWRVGPDMDVMVANVGGKYYTSLQAAIAAAQSGQTVTLLKDVELTGQTNLRGVNLDLNGKTITDKTVQFAFVTQGTVKVKNGKIIVEKTSPSYGIYVANGHTTAEKLTVEAAGIGIYVNGDAIFTLDKDSAVSAAGSAITVIGSTTNGVAMDPTLHIYGKINATGSQPAITGNGTRTTAPGSTINIYDGAEVKADNKIAIYHPQIGTLNITGGLVEGRAAIGIKSGTLNISGSAVVRGTANDTNLSDADSQGNGIAFDGSAIVIDTHTGYAGQMILNISGSATVESLYSYAIREIRNAAATGTNVVKLAVSGNATVKGTEGCIALKDTSVGKISGGTFSTDVTAYCAEGYVAHPVSGSENYNVHSDATSYAHDETNHWTVCTACGNVAEGTTAAHTFGAWVTDTAAQVGVAGSRHHDCVCGYSVTETIPALPGGGGGGGSSSSGGGSSSSGGGTVEIDDPDVPLADLPLPFTDVKDSDWYREAVAYVYGNDLMRGVDGSLFGANTNTTRGMLATIIYRLEKEPETAFEKIFSDVENGKWYSEAIAWGSKNEVVLGYDNGGFGPDDSVTREQLVVMLYRYAVKKGLDMSKKADLSAFADAAQVSGYAKDAMGWAVQNGIIKGRGSNALAPGGLALRVEVAAIFQRFAALYETLV